jgi:hypothetical protein
MPLLAVAFCVDAIVLCFVAIAAWNAIWPTPEFGPLCVIAGVGGACVLLNIWALSPWSRRFGRLRITVALVDSALVLWLAGLGLVEVAPGVLVVLAPLGLNLAAIFTGPRPQRDEGRCARCQYDLTGNTTGVCPECGDPKAQA